MARADDYYAHAGAELLGEGTDVALEGDLDSSRVMRFRHFRVALDTRSLYAGAEEIQVGSRIFDLLVVLLVNRGRVVPKAELIRRVWPALTVDESNLRFQMAGLRRALGPHRNLIRTIPGRGYFFVGDMSEDRAGEPERRSGEGDIKPVPAHPGPYDDLLRENIRLRRVLSDIMLDKMGRLDPGEPRPAHA